MKLVYCEEARHGARILEIFNEAIVNSTALYDYLPRTPQVINLWFEAKKKGSYPVIGVEDASGELLGFASYGPFRAFPAYKYTVEHSVYVDERFRGKGFGQFLLREIIETARRQDYHVLIGAIDSANHVSVALHEKLGFKLCGNIPQVGFKFGKWLDLVLYQLILSTPLLPVDG